MNEIAKTPLTVCMAVYKNDNAEDLLTALRSVTLSQTVPPAELVLVVDGPVPESIEQAIDTFSKEFVPFIVIRFAENRGHAAARQAGIDAASNPLIAIMDSDDISRPDRFEKELAYLTSHPDADVVGGQIEEFETDKEHIISKRVVLLTDEDIKHYLKSRCPMNFQTIMAKKESILKVGGVIDWYCEEDYYLWIRMVQNGCVFANLPDTLVYVRVGNGMYARRGGWKYFTSERGIQRYMLSHRIITLPRYVYNVIGRFVIQVCIPDRLRAFIFQTLFRK